MWQVLQRKRALEPAKAELLPFEEALKKLESIVEAMESEDLPLETLLGQIRVRNAVGQRFARPNWRKLK